MPKKKKNTKFQTFIYYSGIGLGIVLLSAFVSSQLIYPLILGRPKNVETPNLSGMNFASAKRLLNTTKLHIVVRDSVWSDDFKAETVVEQKPEAGTMLKPDGTVYVVLSKGSRDIILPSVLGLSYQQAIAQLRNLGLRAVVIDSLYSDGYVANSVLRTSPSPGMKIMKTATVKLILSKGADPMADQVPEDNTFYPY